MDTSEILSFVDQLESIETAIQAAEKYEDWARAAEMSIKLEELRRTIDLPNPLAVSPALLIIPIRKDEVPPLCDESTASVLHRFPSAHEWVTMLSSNPMDSEPSFLITPLYRCDPNGLVPLSEHDQSKQKAINAMHGWSEYFKLHGTGKS